MRGRNGRTGIVLRIYDFAIPVLLGISSSNINKLQRVQNCLARVVFLDQSSPSTPTAVLDKDHFPILHLESGMAFERTFKEHGL